MASTAERVATDVLERIFGGMSIRQRVAAVASVLIVIQLAFRAWALYGGWFYGDDLKFLSQAATEPLTFDYLFTRHQQQLMPGGLLISWLVGQGPAYAWPLAATTTMLMQAIASGLCLTMLVRLFGWRPGILVPLALYLFSPLTMGAFMWWAAALNQIPLQAAFFGVLITHVAFLRTRRWRWAAASTFVLMASLLFYVKSVVMLPVLALVTVGYFVDGRPVHRVRESLRQFWLVWVGYLAVSVGYLLGYARSGGSPVGESRNAAYLETTDRQVRETLGPTLFGGPWRWLDQGRQDVLAHAPDFAVTLAWMAIAAVVILTCWRRVGAWRAWAILAAYLIPTVYLTASGRSTLFGPEVGLYVRYLSDVSVVACLTLALATMSLQGRPEPAMRGFDPARSLRPVAAVAVLAFVIGSAWSSTTYARYWHVDSPAERYVASASRDLAPLQGVAVIDEPVPDELVLGPNAPFDRPTRLLTPLRKGLRPVVSGNDLQMFGSDGQLGKATVTPGISARISRKDDCGVLIKGVNDAEVPLRGPVTDDTWWMGINYLASGDGTVQVTAGQTSTTVPVLEGPHTVFVRTKGSYGSVSLDSLTSSLGICIDDITVGFIGTFS